MARVPDEEIARLKREVSVERLAEARGVKLRRHGQDLVALCPFHDDKEPSLVISPQKNLWHCLGKCQVGGSVIDWVMKAEGASFRHAVELLRAMSPTPASTPVAPGPPPPLDPEASDAELLGQVVAFYHQRLAENPAALDYLESRGLRSTEAIERFQLGLADRSLGYHLPKKAWKAGASIRGRLQALGVLRESGHEHFNGSLVFPVMDAEGRVVEIYGRKITPNLRKGTPLHLYLPGPHHGVWNLPALAESKEVILCEALIDALSFWCAGHRHVTAAYGIQGFTREHLEAFRAYGTERVLIAYDRDEAGDQAAEKLAAKLQGAGIECYRIQFPRGMDANDYALKVKPASQSLGLVIRKAVWLGRGEPPTPRPQPEATKGKTAVEAEPTPAAEPAPAAEPPPPKASPVPAPAPEIPAEVKQEEVLIPIGDRRYRVRGLAKNLAYDVLKINLLVRRGEGYHADTFDLYSARPRQAFQKSAAAELGVEEGVIKRDLGKVLLKLEELQDQQIQAALEPRAVEVTLTPEEHRVALELLQDPKLLERILADFERCGVVGEETNKLMGYLAAVSRKTAEPLAVILQSSSAAGKTSLMEAVLAFMPAEERVKYSAMTGQSLFYMGESNLKHKILAIVEEEGAERASYALKLLQSEGELSIASTGKDPDTGRLRTHEYRVEGPVMIFLTTTAVDLDDELLNRSLVLTVDESREQTRAIHQIQRERRTLAGLKARSARTAVLALHQNAQRLLRPLAVRNLFAPSLTFLDVQIRTRRDHEKYLTLIDTIALLHQHQRQVRTFTNHNGQEVTFIDVELADVDVANRLASEVLGRSLDELPPQTRRFLDLLEALITKECRELEMARTEYRFTRRQVREQLGWTYDQVRVHLDRLVDYEYVIPHRGSWGQQFVYELVYEGQGREGERFLMKLIDVETLRKASGTTATLGGPDATLGGSGEALGGRLDPDLAPFGGPLGSGVSPSDSEGYNEKSANPEKNAYWEEKSAPSRRNSLRRTQSHAEVSG